MNRFLPALSGVLLAAGALWTTVVSPVSPVSAVSAVSPVSAATAPACTNADLHVTAHAKGAAAGSSYLTLRYTNVSGHACTTGGYGGLSFVGHGNGTQIGEPAKRAPGTPVRSFVLRPGQRATSLVQIAQSGNYDKRACRPTHADGFRVYVPNSRAAQFVPYPTTACASTTIDRYGAQLSHQALRARH